MSRKYSSLIHHHKARPPQKAGPTKPGGAAASDKDKAAARSFSAHRHLHYWRGVGQQINDNKGHVPRKWKIAALSCVGVVIVGLGFALNSSVIITQAVMHADDRVLSTAMEVSPDSVAYLLNNMNVGE